MTHAMTRAMPPARAAPARRATTTTTTARRVLSARSAVRARASAAIASPDARAKEAQAWIDARARGARAGAAGAAGAAAAATTTTFELRRGSRKVSDEKEAALLSTTSFGTIGLSVGLPLLLYGFCAYFSFLPGADISALMLIYGFPISLIGFALKYAELEPLKLVTYEDALKVREEQTTPILTQVRGDVTRYRYGDEQHLEEALKIIFRFNRPGGLRRNQAPELSLIHI